MERGHLKLGETSGVEVILLTPEHIPERNRVRELERTIIEALEKEGLHGVTVECWNVPGPRPALLSMPCPHVFPVWFTREQKERAERIILEIINRYKETLV
jgi:hypothetical protein